MLYCDSKMNKNSRNGLVGRMEKRQGKRGIRRVGSENNQNMSYTDVKLYKNKFN